MRISNAPATRQRASTARVLLDLRGHPVELDEEHRSRALRVAGVKGRLRRLDGDAVHDLHRRRQDPGRDDPGDRVARRVERGERRELRDHGLGLPDDSKRHLDRDPERSLRADDHTEKIGAVVAVDRLAAELEQLPVREHELGRP